MDRATRNIPYFTVRFDIGLVNGILASGFIPKFKILRLTLQRKAASKY